MAEHAPAVAEPLSLAWLLDPVGVDEFLSAIWGREHHHIARGRPDYFETLLPTDAAGLVGLVGHQPSVLRLVRGPDKKGPDNYRNPEGGLDVAAVHRDYRDGYSIVVDGIEQYARSVGTIARSVEVALNHPTQVNAYLTPPGSRGLVPHYDDHDVIVLQIRGSKTWEIYASDDRPARAIQRDGDKAVAVDDLSAPTELTVTAGDALYVPRGRVHAAHANGEGSVHLTVGIHAPTVLMLAVGALYSRSFHDDRLNARLPVRHLDDRGLDIEIQRLISEAIDGLDDSHSVAQGLGLLADVLVRRGTCPPVGRVGGAVDGHTRVMRHHPLYAQVKTTGSGVTLQFASLSIDAAADHEDAMRFLVHAAAPFRVADLPGLRPGQQLDLARTLLASGFLHRLPDADTP